MTGLTEHYLRNLVDDLRIRVERLERSGRLQPLGKIVERCKEARAESLAAAIASAVQGLDTVCQGLPGPVVAEIRPIAERLRIALAKGA